MITYARRFHSSGRRRRLKAKIKLLLHSSKCHTDTVLVPNSGKAGPCLIQYSERVSEDTIGPIDALGEKRILKKALAQQDLRASLLCTPIDPPTYKECVGCDCLSLTDHVDPDIREKMPIVDVQADNMRPTDSKSSELSEDSVVSHPSPATSHKEHERGRRREILYRSQLNDLAARKKISRPSPRAYREARALPQDLICYNTVMRTHERVEGWTRKFKVMRVMIMIVFLCLWTSAW